MHYRKMTEQELNEAIGKVDRWPKFNQNNKNCRKDDGSYAFVRDNNLTFDILYDLPWLTLSKDEVTHTVDIFWRDNPAAGPWNRLCAIPINELNRMMWVAWMMWIEGQETVKEGE